MTEAAKVYRMAIRNIAYNIRQKNTDAFTASSIIAMAFCKDKEEVLDEILVIQQDHIGKKEAI